MTTGYILLAPSGTGKTYAVLHQHGGGHVLVDGDVLIDHITGWPMGRWWDTPQRMIIHRENWAILEEHAFNHRDQIVLFNGYVDKELLAEARVSVAYVHPTFDGLKANSTLRDAARRRRQMRGGRPSSQPAGEYLLESAAYTLARYSGLGLRAFDSISAARNAAEVGNW